MPKQAASRRTFLGLAAFGAAGLAFDKPNGDRATYVARGITGLLATADDVGIKLGVASYSLRNFSRAKAIEMTRALGTAYINLKSVHLPYDASPAEIAAAQSEVEAAGLHIVGGG